MLELLNSYSPGQIIIFLFILFVAIKELIGLIDFFKARNKLWFTAVKKKEDNDISLQKLVEKMDKIEGQLNVLTESDKDDIKSWLVEKYNFYKAYPNRRLSAHTMDTIEKRYSHYKDEGGNSYIDNIIMPGLREMAKEEERVEL